MTETQTQTNDKATEKVASKLLVRLKPFNPKRGHVLKTYTYGGIKFQGERGWYMVTAALGEELKTVRQVHGDEDSALAFDVCTEEEAKAIDAKEADASTPRKTADKSNVVDVSGKGAPAPVVENQGRGGRRGG